MFNVIYGIMILLTFLFYYLRRRHLDRTQKVILSIVYLLSVFCFLILLNGGKPVMPGTYLEQWITPPVKAWLGQK
jgi:hypothetical protein